MRGVAPLLGSLSLRPSRLPVNAGAGPRSCRRRPGWRWRMPETRPAATIETGRAGHRDTPATRWPYPLGQTGDGPPGRPEERTMSSLLIGCSALETSAPGAAAGPSWWERLARRVANEYRIRRAGGGGGGLDERTRRDIGLECTARFGRA